VIAHPLVRCRHSGAECQFEATVACVSHERGGVVRLEAESGEVWHKFALTRSRCRYAHCAFEKQLIGRTSWSDSVRELSVDL
jgi:hypothetical protein